MVSYSYNGVFNESKLNVEFDDKRTYNSFLKNIEKMKKLTITYGEESSIRSDTPSTLNDFKIVQKYDHVALLPPNNIKEEIEIYPEFQFTWNPVMKGKYWNDGMYHFFPMKSKINVELSIEDIISNLKQNGAE